MGELELGLHLFNIFYHVINHKGNWLGTVFRYILDKQSKIDQSGIWTCDLRIDVPALYQLTSPILAVSLFCQYLCSGGGGGGGSQSEVIQPYTAL